MSSDDHQKLTEIIFNSIQNDDPELLGKYVPEKIKSFMCLDLNGLTDIPLLQDEPPLISIAIYFGAKKCAEFLIDTGSDLDATDSILFLYFLIEFLYQCFFYSWNFLLYFNRESVHFLASPNQIQDIFKFLLDQNTDFNATDDDISLQ